MDMKRINIYTSLVSKRKKQLHEYMHNSLRAHAQLVYTGSVTVSFWK